MRNDGETTALDVNWLLCFCAWLIAFVSTLGSLFFSYVMEFAPCVLCWYQRICLFPLVLILARGLFPFDPKASKYALPLAGVGWCLAAYHSLLYAEWIPADMQPCTQGVSCTEVHIKLFGFLSIPYLSLIAFTLLSTILIVLQRRTSV
ncbi:MAG: disulfide bond formation protein B [Candidatus Latescibacterota bacterium]|nr:disulfide bond formation protein B [Candidatus Latescibacterota bacterium]